jgi:hypothetical protein
VSELESWIYSDLKKLDKQDRIIMKELTLEDLYAKVVDLQTEAKITFDAVVVLQTEAMESSLRIKSLEEKLQEMGDVLSY